MCDNWIHADAKTHTDNSVKIEKLTLASDVISALIFRLKINFYSLQSNSNELTILSVPFRNGHMGKQYSCKIEMIYFHIYFFYLENESKRAYANDGNQRTDDDNVIAEVWKYIREIGAHDIGYQYDFFFFPNFIWLRVC